MQEATMTTLVNSQFHFPENSVSWIQNEDMEMVATFPENTSKLDRNIIKNSAEAFQLIEYFIQEVNSGRLKPKSMTNKFQALLDKTFK